MTNEESEYLENGHGQLTPDDDTYLRRFNVNWVRLTERVTESLGGHAVRDEAFWAADSGAPAGFTNSINLMRPLGQGYETTLAAIDSFYSLRDGGEPREVLLFSAWPTPDLRQHGWTLAGHPPVHLLPANRTPTRAPDDLRIVQIDSSDELEIFEQVAIDGYPFRGLKPGMLFGPGLLSVPNVKIWIGYDGDRPVAVAAASLDCDINNVMLVATLPEARGRGFGEALTWVASQIDPTVPAMLLSSDLGRPVYERMGYLPLFRFTLWYRTR